MSFSGRRLSFPTFWVLCVELLEAVAGSGFSLCGRGLGMGTTVGASEEEGCEEKLVGRGVGTEESAGEREDTLGPKLKVTSGSVRDCGVGPIVGN